ARRGRPSPLVGVRADQGSARPAPDRPALPLPPQLTDARDRRPRPRHDRVDGRRRPMDRLDGRCVPSPDDGPATLSVAYGWSGMMCGVTSITRSFLFVVMLWCWNS